jgi:hypothetical protein
MKDRTWEPYPVKQRVDKTPLGSRFLEPPTADYPSSPGGSEGEEALNNTAIQTSNSSRNYCESYPPRILPKVPSPRSTSRTAGPYHTGNTSLARGRKKNKIMGMFLLLAMREEREGESERCLLSAPFSCPTAISQPRTRPHCEMQFMSQVRKGRSANRVLATGLLRSRALPAVR